LRGPTPFVGRLVLTLPIARLGIISLHAMSGNCLAIVFRCPIHTPDYWL
jgi:hypothetical protein